MEKMEENVQFGKNEHIARQIQCGYFFIYESSHNRLKIIAERQPLCIVFNVLVKGSSQSNRNVDTSYRLAQDYRRGGNRLMMYSNYSQKGLRRVVAMSLSQGYCKVIGQRLATLR